MAVFAASGIGSASSVAVSTAAGVFSAHGSTTDPNAVGVSNAEAVFAASGATTADAVGVLALQGVGSAAGAGATDVKGASARQGVGSAAGTTGGTVVGRRAMAGVGADAGAAVIAGVGSAIRFSIAASSGSGEALAVGAPAGAFVADGTSTAEAFPSVAYWTSAGVSSATAEFSSVNASAIGASTVAATSTKRASGLGASLGVATAAGIGGFSWEARAQETGTLLVVGNATIVQTGAATTDVSAQTAVYASAGAASSTLELLENRRSVGSAVGTSVATFGSYLFETLVSSGDAAGSLVATWKAKEVSASAASNELDVTHRRYVVAKSAGTSASVGQAIGGTNGVGESSGSSVTTWVGRGVTVTTAEAAGTAIVLGTGVAVAGVQASAAGAGAAAAIRSGKQQETLVSIGEAETELQFPVPLVYPVFWSNTIGASGATWEGLPFNSMIEVDGVIYAASASGLSKLEDLLDDNGVAVLADVQWDLMDRSDYKQRARSIYIHAVADGPFTVTVENKQGQFSYQTHLPSSSKPMNHRAAIGRGIASRAMRLSLQHNRYFAAGDVNLESGDTTRRI